MIAALPMYDRPETAAANDRLWSLVREHLGGGPKQLVRDGDLWDIWRAPDLMLAQTCSLPFRARLAGQVTIVGSPEYRLGFCPPGYYRSVIVAHKSRQDAPIKDFDDAHLAYNEPLSQSGWAAPWQHFKDRNLRIGKRSATGSHRNSAQMVANGRADFAAIDALSWRMMCDYDLFTSDLVEIDITSATPALPFITSKQRDPVPLRHALNSAISNLSPLDSAVLGLKGLIELPETAYLDIPIPPQP